MKRHVLPNDSWRAYQERLRDMDERDDDRWWLGALGVLCLVGAVAIAAAAIL